MKYLMLGKSYLAIISLSFSALLVISPMVSAAPKVEDSDKNLPVVLATNVASAFSADNQMQQSSKSILPYLSCIFSRIDREYAVRVMPWRRAYQDVKNNRVDGFFTAIPMRQVDPYAVLSAPLLLENWYWFWRADTIAPETWREGYKLGSILGSQQETWLEEAGYNIEVSASNLPQSIKQLNSKRIDVLLADHDDFFRAAQEAGIDPAQFKSRFFRYVPLGVYFNEAFLDRNPKFLTEFNRNISKCSVAEFSLSAFEKDRIFELLSRKIERWKRLPDIELALAKYNRKNKKMNSQAIAKRDAEWIAAFRANNYNYSLDLIDQDLSAQLRELKKQSLDMVTEIILTDARGLNVAISDMTSDYWQGDEKKFTEAFGQPLNTMYFGEINYDESTKHFQVHISVPLQDAKANPSGVMVFGIDVEKALSLIQ